MPGPSGAADAYEQGSLDRHLPQVMLEELRRRNIGAATITTTLNAVEPSRGILKVAHARRFGWKVILRRGRDQAAQSWRKATAGSSLIARRDGIWHASR